MILVRLPRTRSHSLVRRYSQLLLHTYIYSSAWPCLGMEQAPGQEQGQEQVHHHTDGNQDPACAQWSTHPWQPRLIITYQAYTHEDSRRSRIAGLDGDNINDSNRRFWRSGQQSHPGRTFVRLPAGCAMLRVRLEALQDLRVREYWSQRRRVDPLQEPCSGSNATVKHAGDGKGEEQG